MLWSAGVIAGLEFASNFLSAKSKYNQSKAEAQNLLFDAEIYRKNADMIRLNGALNEDIMRSQKRNYLALSRAALGEAGMGESPTASSLVGATSSALEQNILNERYQVESEAENYLYQARVLANNARIMKKNAKNKFNNQMIGSAVSAVASIL